MIDQFARAWVENRTMFRPRSRRMMAMELRQKGLDDEAVPPQLKTWTTKASGL